VDIGNTNLLDRMSIALEEGQETCGHVLISFRVVFYTIYQRLV